MEYWVFQHSITPVHPFSTESGNLRLGFEREDYCQKGPEAFGS